MDALRDPPEGMTLEDIIDSAYFTIVRVRKRRDGVRDRQAGQTGVARRTEGT